MSRTGNDPSTSKSAKILYRPIGLASSVVGGLLANLVFKKVWQQSAPGDHPDPPMLSRAGIHSKRSPRSSPAGGHLLAGQDTRRPRRRPGVSAVERRMARPLTSARQPR